MCVSSRLGHTPEGVRFNELPSEVLTVMARTSSGPEVDKLKEFRTMIISMVRRQSAHRFRAAILLAAAAAIAPWFLLQAGVPAKAQAPAEKVPSEKVYKNIQVFRGLPSLELMENMFYMEGALGVGCKNCHVNFKDFEKDDNPHKQTARRMIEMVRVLNKENFGGQSVITCNTCHRGRSVPLAPLAFAAIKNSEATKVATAHDAVPSLTVDQILDRYVSATGGQSAHEKFTTALLTGSLLSSEGWTAPLKIYIGATNKLFVTFDVGWISYSGFNGREGWEQDNNSLHDLTGKNLVLLKREAAIFHTSLLKEQYSSLTLRDSEMIDEHEAYVVEGVMPGSDNERLYFDVKSGLLVRIQSGTETSLGVLPHQIELRDYREVGGVKMPFEVQDFAADFSSVYKIADGKYGASIPAGLFDKPAEPLKGFPK